MNDKVSKKRVKGKIEMMIIIITTEYNIVINYLMKFYQLYLMDNIYFYNVLLKNKQLLLTLFIHLQLYIFHKVLINFQVWVSNLFTL